MMSQRDPRPRTRGGPHLKPISLVPGALFLHTHDTGSAFKGRPDKRDIAVGNFSGWDPSRASAFVSAGPGGFRKPGGMDDGGGAVPPWVQDAQCGAVDSAINGWDRSSSPSGRLNLDVNVRAPRGTKVDADVTGGDFIPADRGISVNREMTQE